MSKAFVVLTLGFQQSVTGPVSSVSLAACTIQVQLRTVIRGYAVWFLYARDQNWGASLLFPKMLMDL